MSSLTKKNSDKTIALVGCVAQAENEEIFKKNKYVDIVLGPQSYHLLPKMINAHNEYQKKQINTDFIINEKFDFISISNLKLVSESPKKSLNFNSKIKIKISTETQINSKNLKKLKDLVNTPIVISEKSGKRYEKTIFDLRYKKNSKNVFTITITVQGGLPIKRFIVGDGVLPNVSTLFDTPCVILEFDFLDIAVK